MSERVATASYPTRAKTKPMADSRPSHRPRLGLGARRSRIPGSSRRGVGIREQALELRGSGRPDADSLKPPRHEPRPTSG